MKKVLYSLIYRKKSIILAAMSILLASSCQQDLHAAGVEYAYDQLNRVIRVSHEGAHITYSYDANGNRLLKSVCSLCQGDLNADGKVDVADLKVFVSDFGRTDCIEEASCPADFDADGDVDISDLRVLKLDFGRKNCRQCP